jgi:hypothetical protein
MNRKISRMVFGIFVFFIFTDCTSTTLITKSVRDSLMDEQLYKVQYYLDEDILLYRELNTSEAPAVSSGKVIYRNGKRLEEILISKKTPGELINISSFIFTDDTEVECLGICFEASNNDLDKILWFKPGKYKRDWPDGYYLIYYGAGTGKEIYGDKIYSVTITSGSEDAWPYLLGVIKSSNTQENSRRKVKGRKIK